MQVSPDEVNRALAFLMDHGHYVVRLPRMSGRYVSIDGELRTFEAAVKMAMEESRTGGKPVWAGSLGFRLRQLTLSAAEHAYRNGRTDRRGW